MTAAVALCLAAALVGGAAGLLARRWTDAEAGARTATWLHVVVPAALSAAAAWRFAWSWELPAYVYFAVISGPLTIVDLRAHRLPNQLTITAYPIIAALLALPAVAAASPEAILRAGAGALALLTFYLVLHLVNPGGMGLGDVKLAGPMGALLAWLGWSTLLVGGFLGFAFGAVAGIVLLATRRASRRSALPFGPFMLAGAWTAILAGDLVAGGLLP